MKKTRIISLLITCALFLCFAIYVILPKEFGLLINAPIEVPACHSRIADKLNIQAGTVRSYILDSLQPEMTSHEVEMALNQIAPFSVIDTFIDNDQNTHETVRVNLCSNPFGNVILGLYYSKDGYLMNAVDEWAD